MRVYSFIRQGIELRPIEVELSLMPGVPQFQIMGLPDLALKESQLRIRSALKHQGFKLPAKTQVLVNLKPSHIRKTSRGLDLAIACAFLWKTGQLDPPQGIGDKPYIYGELSLEGQVDAPDDFDALFEHPKERPILSGAPKTSIGYDVLGLKALKDLGSPQLFPAANFEVNLKRPPIPDINFCQKSAELMSVIATGEHSVLLAGPAGSGKTTVAEAIHAILKEPTAMQARRIQQISKLFGRPAPWRPLISPHHTIPPLSMIGGGSPPFPGEITRAHGGTLILDEFLEFHSQVKEALREPVEKGEITIARLGEYQKYPAKFLLVATSNLCPCGDFVPNKMISCRFSLMRCRSYTEKLSGPILDRFEVLAFSDQWRPDKAVSLNEIFEKVQQAQKFAKYVRGQKNLNSELTVAELEPQMDRFLLENLLPEHSGSRRRKRSLLRVARSCADLDKSKKIAIPHLEQAARLTTRPFEEIKRIFN